MTTASVQLIDESSAARILTLRTVIIGNALTLLPLLITLAGMGVAGGAAYLAFVDDVKNGEEPLLDASAGGLLAAAGAVVAVVAGYWSLRNVTKIGNWYLRRRARGEIKSRPDGLVDPDDPEAIFVEIVPRKNWKRLMLETATDVGFLLVDESRREVLFEGDHERMRIPAAAILSCKAEWAMIGDGSIKYYFTVLRIAPGAGSREVPFAYRGDMGQLGADIRERRAETLRDRILSLSEQR